MDVPLTAHVSGVTTLICYPASETTKNLLRLRDGRRMIRRGDTKSDPRDTFQDDVSRANQGVPPAPRSVQRCESRSGARGAAALGYDAT